MFGRSHYVPILKGKEGEFSSLRNLAQSVKERLTPVVEVMPVAWDFINDQPQKSLDEHLRPIAEKIQKAWGAESPIFIDAPWTPAQDKVADGRTTLSVILDGARELGLLAIPVTRLDRENDYQQAVKQAVKNDGRGVCIRLQSDDFDDMGTLGSALDDLLKRLGSSRSDADLIIDLRAISADQTPALALAVSAIVGGLPHVSEWRTLTLAGSSFPENLAGIHANEASKLDRAEWGLWSLLVNRKKPLIRIPTFGDYAIAHPDQADEIDPRVMKMSAQLRYTADTYWLVLKGKNVRDHGYEQFNALCKNLIGQSEYCGRNYSWGDQYIDDCAQEKGGPGNATIWRRVGTTHHLTFVTEQIASLS